MVLHRQLSSKFRLPKPYFVRKTVFSNQLRRYSSRELDTIEAYENEWVDFFKKAPDQFELYRGLNNVFSYDLVPTIPVVVEALHASRRLDHLPSAIRLLAAIRAKVDTENQYKLYLQAIEDLRLELGVPIPEEIGI